MPMRPAERWRFDLTGWELPEELVLRGEPDGLTPELARRMRRREAEASPTPTTRIVHDLAGEAGSVLDVGAGTGRASLPLTLMGHRVTAVEEDEDLAFALRQEAESVGADVTLVVGSWPVVAGNAGVHDVVMSADVVYRVPEIEPFLRACLDGARRAVVIELSEHHPWRHLARYFRMLHGIDRPDGPSAELFVRVVEELIGAPPTVERWTAPPTVVFEDHDELVEFYRRRLAVPAPAQHEVAALLDADIVEDPDGWLHVGPATRELAAVWWSVR